MSLITGGSGTRRERSSLSSSSSTLTTMGKSLAAKGALGAVDTFESLTGFRFDPAPAYLFYVELEGMAVALFTECSGLDMTRDVEEWEEGGVNTHVHKLPGRVKFSNITLKRGFSLSRILWDWFNVGMYDFYVERLNFSIVQGAPGHNLLTAITGAAGVNSGGGTAEQLAFQALGKGFGKIKHWNVEDAFPVSWTGPDLSTSSSSVAIEALEIAHHGLELSYEAGTPMSPGASLVGAAASAISG